MQDCKDQKRGDIVSPWKKNSVLWNILTTTQQRLIFQWFSLLNWKYPQLQANKQDREKDRLNPTQSKWYFSVCQMGFRLCNQVRRHEEEEHWMSCKSLTDGRSRVQAWSLRGQPSLTAEKYGVLTLRCTRGSIWRATVQWLLDKAEQSVVSLWLSSVSAAKNLNPNLWLYLSVACLLYTQDFLGLCTFQAIHPLVIYPESPWSLNPPTKTLGQNWLSNPVLKWNTTEVY